MRVAISGMGIAGPALAYWLLRSGRDVTLVERAPRFRSGGYIVDFWGVGYNLAERMGILSQVLEAGYSVRRVQLVDERGRQERGLLNRRAAACHQRALHQPPQRRTRPFYLRRRFGAGGVSFR